MLTKKLIQKNYNNNTNVYQLVFLVETGILIDKQSKYDVYDETFDGRNSFSKNDKDVTFMHMK